VAPGHVVGHRTCVGVCSLGVASNSFSPQTRRRSPEESPREGSRCGPSERARRPGESGAARSEVHNVSARSAPSEPELTRGRTKRHFRGCRTRDVPCDHCHEPSFPRSPFMRRVSRSHARDSGENACLGPQFRPGNRSRHYAIPALCVPNLVDCVIVSSYDLCRFKCPRVRREIASRSCR
jgi:hypothetical protein